MERAGGPSTPPWFEGLARILRPVEESGVWPEGLLAACIAMIPKSDGDATPLGQRPLCVSPVVYRIWASARMSWSLGSGLGYRLLFLVLAGGVALWTPGLLLP